jgi:hypothetical protein
VTSSKTLKRRWSFDVYLAMERPMTNDAEKPKDLKYWICDVCSTALELTTKYPTGGNTISQGVCDWCGDHEWVTPIVDFKESGSKTWD